MERIDLILKERHNRKFRSSWSWESYYKKFLRTDKLLKEIEKKIKFTNCVQEARKQYITAYVTAFEVYFKDTFLTLLNVFGNTKIIEQIKIKFDVLEVKRIITEHVSINEVIASYYNFQDLDQINKAFSAILCVPFLEELKKMEFKIGKDDSSPLKLDKNFYKEIKSFIDLRHDFVHDINFKKKITSAELYNYINVCDDFILCVDVYINEQQTKKEANLIKLKK